LHLCRARAVPVRHTRLHPALLQIVSLAARKSEGNRPSCAGLAPEDALCLDVERIDRLARRHEQPVALLAAETDIGAALRQQDGADKVAVRREHGDAVLALATREAAPHIAVGIDADAIGIARHRVEEYASVYEPFAVIDDIVNMHGLVAARRVDDV